MGQTQGCRQPLVPSNCLISARFRLHLVVALCAVVNLCVVVSLLRGLPVGHDDAEDHQHAEVPAVLPMHYCCEADQMPLVNYLGSAVSAAAASAVAGLHATGDLHAEAAQAAVGGLNRASHLPAEHPRGEVVRVCGGQGPWGVERGGHRLNASEGCAGEGLPAVSTDCCVVGGPRWLHFPPGHSNAIELTEQSLPLAPPHPVPMNAVDLPVEASEAVAQRALGAQTAV